MMEIKEIMSILPHAYPFLLVDRIIEVESGKRIVGLKNVTFNEPFFPGHFPGRPIMPGVLIVEAMAQTAGILVFSSLPRDQFKTPVYFLGIDNVRFRKPVIPGDQLRLLKAHLRRIGARTIDALWRAIGDICALYSEQECWNYFKDAGYAPD